MFKKYRTDLEQGFSPEDLLNNWINDDKVIIDNVNDLEYMIECLGVNVEFTSSKQITLLMEMIHLGKTDCVRDLLYKYNVNVNAQNEFGVTALINASRCPFYPIKELLAHPDINVNLCDHLGQHPLIYALWYMCLYGERYLNCLLPVITEKEVLVTVQERAKKWATKSELASINRRLRLLNKRKIH